MLPVDIIYKRRQQVAEHGQALAEWLNDPKWEKNEVRCRIAVMVAFEELARDKAVVDAVLRSQGITGADLEEFARSNSSNKPAAHIRWMNLTMRGKFVPWGHGVGLEFEPADEPSRHLYAWSLLYNTGMESRLRKCPNCGKFWYCEGRTDRKTCSKACKDALWGKTPEGRKAKREYMHDLRVKRKKLWEAKQKGRRVKPGRNPHVSLKKGE